jgi:hypothetical protein
MKEHMKKSLWTVLLLVLWATTAHAQIARDAVSSGGAIAYFGVTSCLDEIVVGSGSNRLLVMSMITVEDTIDAVDFNATPMTFLAKVRSPSDLYVQIWYQVAPAVGNHVVYARNVGGATQTACIMGAVSYTGVDQTDPIDVSGTNTAASVTSITSSVTTVTDNVWTIIAARNNGGPQSPGTGSTNIGLEQDTYGYTMYDSNGALTPPGSKSMQITFPGTVTATGTVMAAICPATTGCGGGGGGGGGSPVKLLLLLGVGF